MKGLFKNSTPDVMTNTYVRKSIRAYRPRSVSKLKRGVYGTTSDFHADMVNLEVSLLFKLLLFIMTHLFI